MPGANAGDVRAYLASLEAKDSFDALWPLVLLTPEERERAVGILSGANFFEAMMWVERQNPLRAHKLAVSRATLVNPVIFLVAAARALFPEQPLPFSIGNDIASFLLKNLTGDSVDAETRDIASGLLARAPDEPGWMDDVSRFVQAVMMTGQVVSATAAPETLLIPGPGR